MASASLFRAEALSVVASMGRMVMEKSRVFSGRQALDVDTPNASSSQGFVDKTLEDLEVRLVQEDHRALKLWLRMLSCTNLIVSILRSRLQSAFSLSMARFEFLAQLERHPEGLRMSDISRRMMVSSGNVTSLADRLEANDLVVREVDARDRRAVKVRLTTSGQKFFAEVAQAHEGWVIELFEGLTEEEKNALYQLLGKLKEHVKEVANGASKEKGGWGSKAS